MEISVVNKPCVCKPNAHYASNRVPLLREPLLRLPLGSVQAQGWLKHQLDLMVEGMIGRLMELSSFLKDNNGWFGGDEMGWEEQPYWFRGFYPLAILTGDLRCLAEASRWMEAIFSSQDKDGYFGAKYHKCIKGKKGQKVCDLWPHMIMLDAIILHYEYTNDERVIPFMERFFQFCRKLPDKQFIRRYLGRNFSDWRPVWQHDRSGDMLPHIYWLYNRTGQSWLLDLATRFFQHIKPPTNEWLDMHIVNFTQRFAYAGVYYVQSKDEWHREAPEFWYQQHMSAWGQQPRGIFGADEILRSGYTDPRQGFETCGMTEFAKNFYLLGRITGDTKYADRCEDIMLNHFPASQTADLKALHYLTAANQPQLDASENHDYFNKGRQISYSPHEIYRCCQHNVAMGWPWYVQNLWQATSCNGLAAWMYAASKVTAQVGAKGNQITIDSKTDYPFDGRVSLQLSTAKPIDFPLYLRVPQWCTKFSVKLNGQSLKVNPGGGSYVLIRRPWKNGDKVDINMGMAISLTQWPRNGSVTVDRGPLSYSVKIGERWKKCGGTESWPDWEAWPTTPWNYGLVIDRNKPQASLKVIKKGVRSEQPWTVNESPIEIRAKVKRIPNWKLVNETADELQLSPIKSNQSQETITMIPLGCARLRMSCLPTVEHGPQAKEWEKPKPKKGN